MGNAPSEASDYFCSSFGGAVKNAPPGGSAFAHRDALFYAEPGAGWNGDAITPAALAWVAEFSQALRPYVSGAYVNVPNLGMLDWETAYWGDHYARLREIKAKYDPDNVFQYEQSEPFSSSDFAGLEDVDGLGDLAGLPGAAAELAQDVPALELGVRTLAGRAELGVGGVGGLLRGRLAPAPVRNQDALASADTALVSQRD